MNLKQIFLLCLLVLFSFNIQAKDRVEIAEQNAAAVVTINVLRSDASTFTGTGFLVSPDGLIATSRHVTQDALYMNITFNSGAVSGQAVPVALNDKVDLALLKIEARNLSTVYLDNSDYVLPGQEITVIGNPRRLQNTVSSGIISQVRKKADGVLWLQISAPISPSSSGSPVFNEDGRVVGVAFGSYKGEGNQNLNFAVPSNYLSQMIQESGYTPPLTQPDTDAQPQPSLWEKIVNHLRLSWQSTRRLFNRNRQ